MKKQMKKITLSRETLIHLVDARQLPRAGAAIDQRYTQSCNANSGCLTCSPCRLT